MSREIQVEGQPIGVPAVDVHSIGAGGGSIAWIDAGGALRVGPRSAGARPGPACYDFGGTEPTVTDANVVLGYLNPEAFLGGRRALRDDLSRQAVDEHVGGPLGLETVAAAAGIVRVVNANMVGAIRSVSVDRGVDPRGFTLVCGGGAGGLHATELARELGMERVFVPLEAGVFCAFGMTVTDVRHDHVTALHAVSDEFDLGVLNAAIAALEEAARTRLAGGAASSAEEIELERSVDARYPGQVHEITVPVPTGTELGAAEVETLVAAFHEQHRAQFAYNRDSMPIECLHWRVGAIGRVGAGAAAGAGRGQRGRGGADPHRPGLFQRRAANGRDADLRRRRPRPRRHRSRDRRSSRRRRRRSSCTRATCSRGEVAEGFLIEVAPKLAGPARPRLRPRPSRPDGGPRRSGRLGVAGGRRCAVSLSFDVDAESGFLGDGSRSTAAA